MVTGETFFDLSVTLKTPRQSIWGILLGFSLFHIAQSIFWQFGSYYLFAGLPGTTLFLIGLVGGLPVLIGLTGVYFWGALSDKFHRRIPFMIFGFIAQALAFFIYIFIRDSLSFLIVTCIAYFFSVAAVPLANAYLTEARAFKGGAVGLLLATSSLGWAIGAFGGGLLFTGIGMSGLFLLGAFAYLIGGILILLLVRELPTHPTGDIMRSVHSEKPTKIGMKSTSENRVLLTIAAAVAIGSIGVNAFSFFFGLYLIHEISGTAEMLGIANGFASLTGLVFTLAAGYGSDRIGRKPIILLGFVGYAVFMIVYLFIINPWIAMILWIIPLYPLVYTASYAAAADLSKIVRRGRAMSIVAAANSIGTGIGPILGGVLVQFILSTLRVNMVLAVIMNIIAFVIVLFLVSETLQQTHKKSDVMSDNT